MDTQNARAANSFPPFHVPPFRIPYVTPSDLSHPFHPSPPISYPQAAAGVFPVMVFVHGTGGWRTNSATIIHKWVSRGWVVFAIDYPGIWLRDLVQLATNPFLYGRRACACFCDARGH